MTVNQPVDKSDLEQGSLNQPVVKSDLEQGSLGGSKPPPKQRPFTVTFVVIVIVLIASTVTLFGGVTDEAIGALALVVMVCLLALRAPVWVALMLPSLMGMYAARGLRLVESSLGITPYNAVAQWTFTVVPMFVFMGLLISTSGIAKSVFTAMKAWLGWLPGGYAVGTNLAGAGLSAVSGSTVGVVYTMARVAVPEMLRAGYDRRFAAVAVMLSGLCGNLIPPSILLVLYAGIAGTPVGPQLLSGLGPGLVLGAVAAITMALAAAVVPRLTSGPTIEDSTGDAEPGRFRSLLNVWPLPVIFIVTFGGLFSGTFTATEVGAAAAAVTLLAALLYRRQGGAWTAVRTAAVSTVTATGMMLLILIAVVMLSNMLAVTGVGPVLVDAVVGFEMGRTAFLLMLVVFFIILGTFMDTLAMMVVTVPIILPMLAAYDVSPLWFGVFVVFLGEIGMITPPVGMIVFVVQNVMQNPEINQGQTVSMRDIMQAVIWVMPIAVLFCLILIFFPGLTEVFLGNSR
jgi:C4-dicarboxylate transporter DctM subunit